MSDIEYRFVICDDKISTHGSYSWNKSVNKYNYEETEDFKKCVNLVEKTIDNFSHDLVYTIDCCICDKKPKIIEINSWACAGLYNCDRVKMIKDINQMIIKRQEDFIF